MAKTYKDLTREDCELFRREHPKMTRKYLYQHHSTYARAMQRLGIFDELWPSLQTPWTELTVEDCVRFRREHPDLTRRQLRIYHGSYMRAMRALECLDRLYPVRKVSRFSDEELIVRARKHRHVRDLIEKDPQILKAIYKRGGEVRREALKHMKPLGNRKLKLIYAYEFPDGTAYVGLTYDEDRRQKDHLYEDNSAVRRHREQTGLKPVYRKLTELLPVEDAQRMEGEWKERYEKDGWTMLNVVATGGIGGSLLKIDKNRVIKLFKSGVPAKAIPGRMDVAYSTVSKILKRAGLSYRGMSNVPIEVLDDEGLVIETFPSIKDAADAWGMHPANVRKNMKNGWRTRGHYLRHNPEAYRVKYGKEPPEWEGVPKKQKL
ncbi:MAG: hypothetical protein IJ551_09985 [Prevotella sp.]|nr:hypothetical protein [Prevotella sp.]